jgi:hypothetical protein
MYQSLVRKDILDKTDKVLINLLINLILHFMQNSFHYTENPQILL